MVPSSPTTIAVTVLAGSPRGALGAGFVYKRGGGILDTTHPPNFGPTHPTFDPPRPPPLL